MTQVIFRTDGLRGLWNNRAKAVTITDIQLGYIDDELDQHGRCTFGELRVYFDIASWNVREDGLIYTDRGWIADLREFLNAHGLVADDVSYSEQGMQGDDYVSLDVGELFLASWAEKFNIVWANVLNSKSQDFAVLN
jgi:hypothetical protein